MSNFFGFTRQLVLAMAMSISGLLMAAESTPLYTYNTPPPFYPGDSDDLSSYLAKFLSEASNKKFEALYLPRKRLDKLVSDDNWQGAIMWANPTWFNDPERQTYLWSNPIATDYNLVLSHKHRPLEYQGPRSLIGLKLGGILGHVYVEFEEMIKQGSLIRENTHSYESNLLKLKAGRVDVIFIPASSLSILLKLNPDMRDWLHIAKQPRSKFQYFFFCERSNSQLISFLNEQIKRLENDTEWNEEVRGWQEPTR